MKGQFYGEGDDKMISILLYGSKEVCKDWILDLRLRSAKVMNFAQARTPGHEKYILSPQ
jgi:hypothetical protein